MKLGAHISVSNGLAATTSKIQSMGGNCLQIFASPPRNWSPPKWTETELTSYKELLNELKIGPNFLHGIYLVNLQTLNDEIRAKAIESVLSHAKVAQLMGAVGVIIHTHRPDEQFLSAIDEIVSKLPKDTLLILEHSAINSIEQTLSLFTDKNKSKLGLCLDTCHLFAAGYDIRKPKIIDELISKIDTTIGLDMLKVIHTNDCKSLLGSKRDNHQNIGQGSIGKEAFKFLLNHPRLKDIPFILETPGFDDKGPDKENLDILKSLV